MPPTRRRQILGHFWWWTTHVFPTIMPFIFHGRLTYLFHIQKIFNLKYSRMYTDTYSIAAANNLHRFTQVAVLSPIVSIYHHNMVEIKFREACHLTAYLLTILTYPFELSVFWSILCIIQTAFHLLHLDFPMLNRIWDTASISGHPSHILDTLSVIKV